MKLLLALVLLSLFTTCAQAYEITYALLIQPLSAVREACAHKELPEAGCVSILPAVDNPNDVLCQIRIPSTVEPWDVPLVVELLRPECEEILVGRGG